MHKPSTRMYCLGIKLRQLQYNQRAAQGQREYYAGITEERERANERARIKYHQKKLNSQS